MSARLQWQGLEEFKRALRALPEDLTDEAGAIVERHAVNAERELIQAYPDGPTGNLRRRVQRQVVRSPLSVRALVKSRAPHASMFEKGTGSRRTARGWNRGRMPAAPEAQRMIPIMMRQRHAMIAALMAVVRRAGFLVPS